MNASYFIWFYKPKLQKWSYILAAFFVDVSRDATEQMHVTKSPAGLHSGRAYRLLSLGKTILLIGKLKVLPIPPIYAKKHITSYL